jgi:hypothetical protein
VLKRVVHIDTTVLERLNADARKHVFSRPKRWSSTRRWFDAMCEGISVSPTARVQLPETAFYRVFLLIRSVLYKRSHMSVKYIMALPSVFAAGCRGGALQKTGRNIKC